MSKEKFPIESDSQKIGQMAIRAFDANYPEDWHPAPLDGDTDYGTDYWVQVSKNGQIRHSFFLQLKGSKEIENGEPKKLSSDGTFYSQSLNFSTLNKYYSDIVPIMLVFADLTQDNKPRNCKVYYKWLDEETLKSIIKNKGHQKSTTFRISTENVLNDDVNVIPYLEDFENKHRALNTLWNSIPFTDRHDDKVEKVNAISSRFRSNPTLVDSILQDDDVPWINALKGSFAFKLKEIAKNLDSFILGETTKQLGNISEQEIESASVHERAEYYHLYARLYSMTNRDIESLEFYKRAFQTFPENGKYHVTYLENQINCNHSNEAVIEKAIEELELIDSIKAHRVKAKALALLGNSKALEILASLPEKETLIIKPLCLLLLKQYNECCTFAKSHLRESDNKTKLKLQLFLIKSLFSLGYGKSIKGKVVPFSGCAGMNIAILQECWNYVKSIWSIAANLGYPDDTANIVDISCILGAFFEDIDAIYSHLVNFAEKYKELEYFQLTVLTISLNKNDLVVAERLLHRIDQDDILSIMCQIEYEYKKNNFKTVAELVCSNLSELCRQKPYSYDSMLLKGVECSEKSLMYEEKKAILNKIKDLPDSLGILASYHFFEKINKSQLNSDEAMKELYDTFNNGCTHSQVLYLLIKNLNPHIEANFEKISKVTQEIEKQRPLLRDEFYTYANALIVSEQWDLLLQESEKEISHYPNDIKLLSLKAMALDQIGETPQALNILQGLFELSESDRFTLEISLNVFLRCGFVEQGKVLLTKLLPLVKDKQEKFQLLRMLYNVEMRIDSNSHSLIDYCFKLGELVDQENIEQEGGFLQLAWPLVINSNILIDDEKKAEFQKRLKAYTQKFPESSILKEIQIPKNADPEEIFNIIDKATGSISRHETLVRYESKIKEGKLTIPFSIRYNFLPNITDLLHLWQVMKQSNHKHTQYQLAFSDKMYNERNTDYILNRSPLIDEITLILLNELDLLNELFLVFQKVIITKATIARLFNWGQIPVSVFSNIARSITDFLKLKIDQIIQPSCNIEDSLNYNINDLLEYGEVLKKREDAIFYSDDGLARSYIYQSKFRSKGMTTIDLLEIIRNKGFLSEENVATKYAKLCEWNTAGLQIRFLDILRLIHQEDRNTSDIEKARKQLEHNHCFTSMVNAIWFPHKPYENCLIDIASVIKICLEDTDIILGDGMISAIWMNWYLRVLHKGNLINDHDFSFLADSFYFTALNLARFHEEGDYVLYSSRLWRIYISFANNILSKTRIEDIDYQVIAFIARRVALIKNFSSINRKVYNFIYSGIKKNSMSLIFNREYTNTIINKH